MEQNNETVGAADEQGHWIEETMAGTTVRQYLTPEEVRALRAKWTVAASGGQPAHAMMYNALLDAAKQAGFPSIGDAIRAAGSAQLQAAAPSDLQQIKALALPDAVIDDMWRDATEHGGDTTQAFVRYFARLIEGPLIALIEKDVEEGGPIDQLVLMLHAQRSRLLDENAKLLAQLARQQAAPAAIPEGWKLVPMERGYDERVKQIIAFNQCTGDLDDKLEAAHAALLAAAPAQPAPQALLDHAHAEPDYGLHIALGQGKIEVGQGHHGEARLPAILFGRNGAGAVGVETEGDRVMEPGECIAAITFTNPASLDVVAEKLAELRARIWPDAPAGEVNQGTADSVRKAALDEAIAVCKADRAWRSVDGIRAIQRAAQPNIQEAGNAAT